MKSKSKNVLKQKKVHKSKGRIHESIVTDTIFKHDYQHSHLVNYAY